MKLILINLSKRINKVSVISVIIFVSIISILSIYYGDFGYKDYIFKIEQNEIARTFIIEMNEVITIVGTLFVSLLAFLEIINNSEAYDSYFLTRVGRTRYYISKLISYLLVIIFVFLSVYAIMVSIYLYRFKSVKYLKLFVNLYLNNNIYFIIMYMVSFILVLISKNIFIPMLSFILFWLERLLENVAWMKYILPTVKYDIVNETASFNTDYYYEYAFLFMLFVVSYVIYIKKDIKC